MHRYRQSISDNKPNRGGKNENKKKFIYNNKVLK
jgi:hypothetical protein